jgi:hypothetical protein
MEALSARRLLNLWERGLREGPIDRGLTLWQAACPGASREALAALQIGRRDAGLLDLREQLFGPRMATVLQCARCGGELELVFDIDEIRAAGAQAAIAGPAAAQDAASAEGESLSLEDHEVRFRLPSSLDLLAVAGELDVEAQRSALLERCVLAVASQGTPVAADRLPPTVADAVVARMAELDPQADVEIETTCPDCHLSWKAALDIASFLWSELDAWARRLLREVHVLASAYHWPESEILELSSLRRQLYLELVAG